MAGAELKDFINKYWPSIITVVITFLKLIIVFQIVGVDFNPVEDKHIQKVVTIESFDTEPNQETIPKANNNDAVKIHNICTGFSDRACKTASYCVLLGNNKEEPAKLRCVGGRSSGPTYLTEKGKDVEYDYYYHKHKCHGACPQEKE